MHVSRTCTRLGQWLSFLTIETKGKAEQKTHKVLGTQQELGGWGVFINGWVQMAVGGACSARSLLACLKTHTNTLRGTEVRLGVPRGGLPTGCCSLAAPSAHDLLQDGCRNHGHKQGAIH